MKLYWLFKNNPAPKSKMLENVNEGDYYDLAKFWINTGEGIAGYLYGMLGANSDECEKWIKGNNYSDPNMGTTARRRGVYIIRILFQCFSKKQLKVMLSVPHSSARV